ncbi:hypothetical protein [Sphingobium sp. Z007]
MPFRLFAQGFLLADLWMQDAVKGLPGVSPANERIVSYLAGLWLDVASPANMPWMNPSALSESWASGGTNLLNGFQNHRHDAALAASGATAPDNDRFVPGKDVATTPGTIVFRNELIELIQYDGAGQARTSAHHAAPGIIAGFAVDPLHGRRIAIQHRPGHHAPIAIFPVG